jgi:hypothetical protein
VALVLYRAAAAQGAAPEITLPCLALVMILAAARFLERPHIFSYLLLALYLLVLARRRLRGADGWAGWREPFLVLPLLQVLWANLHGGFILGPATVLLAAIGLLVDGLLARRDNPAAAVGPLRDAARLGSLAAVLLASCLLNPYGWELLRFPFALTGSAFMDLIYEWLPPFDSAFRTTYMMRYYVLWTALGALALGAALARARRGARSWPESFPYLLFAGFLALSLRMNRNVTDFALATLPGVSAALTAALEPGEGRAGGRRRAALPIVAAGILGLALYFAVAGYPFSPSSRRFPGFGLGRKVPVAAADYLEVNGIRGACFNTYAAGAYLVYRFYPEVRVGMDSRNDVHGEALYAEYRTALVDPGALRRMLGRLDASFLFLEWAQPGMAATARMIREVAGDWRLVFFDDAAVVYLREDGPYAAIVRRDGYGTLDPSLLRPGDWTAEQAGRALVEAERAVAQSGGAYIARVMLIEALRTLGRAPEADVEEARIVREDPPLPHIDILLGMAHLARGDRATAAARLRRALELNPHSDAARDLLRQAAAEP